MQGEHKVSGDIRNGGVSWALNFLLPFFTMYHPENPSTLSFELELELMLNRIQHGADVVKEEVWLGMEGYWEAVRVHNEEHRWMRWHNALQGVSLVMEELEVCAGVQSAVWSSDWRFPDNRS